MSKSVDEMTNDELNAAIVTALGPGNFIFTVFPEFNPAEDISHAFCLEMSGWNWTFKTNKRGLFAQARHRLTGETIETHIHWNDFVTLPEVFALARSRMWLKMWYFVADNM